MERVKSHVENLVSSKPSFVKLCHESPHVYALYKLADNENWEIQRFLEECVLTLAQFNKTLIRELVDCGLHRPIIIMKEKEMKNDCDSKD